MILAVGLSPAWQQTLLMDNFQTGRVNRAGSALWWASGKVINVGRALHQLGRGTQPSRTLCLVGGLAGEAIEREFRESLISARWIHSETPTRVCTTILDRSRSETTELVENAAGISTPELSSFRKAYREEAAGVQCVVLSGSLPAGTPVDFYQQLLKETTCPAILDFRGPELEKALEQKPFLVKPNRLELETTLGRPLSTDEELIRGMRELNERGAEWTLVSQGAGVAWLTSRTETYSFTPLAREVVNPIGCGDCVAAGIAWGLAQGCPIQECVQIGMAAASCKLEQLLPAKLDPQIVLDRKAEISCVSHAIS